MTMRIRVRVFLLAGLLITGMRAGAQNLDSLRLAVRSMPDDTNKVNALFAITEICDEREIKPYAQQCLELAGRLDYKKGIANASLNLGFALNLEGDISGSISCFQRSLDLYTVLGDKKGIAVAHNNLGLTFGNQGNMKAALDHYLEGLALQEEIGDQEGAATSLNNIGLVYAGQGDEDKALEFYFRGLKKLVALGNKRQIAYCYNNIANIYTHKKMYGKSLNMLLNGLAIQEQLSDSKGIAYILNQMGQVEELLGNTSLAAEHFERSLAMAQKAGDKAGISYALRNLAAIEKLKGNYQKAEDYCTRSLQMSRELGYPEAIAGVSELLSLIYTAENKHPEAFGAYKLYVQMKDSVTNLETQKSTLKKQMQYDFDQKEAQAKAEQDKKDVVTRIVLCSIAGGFVLVLLLAVFIFRSYRQKRRANIIITRQKEEVEQQKLRVEEQQKHVLDSIHYARRIQRSLLPNEKYIERKLRELRNV
jgi:tetratricopeptide (TPR) repeat protein